MSNYKNVNDNNIGLNKFGTMISTFFGLVFIISLIAVMVSLLFSNIKITMIFVIIFFFSGFILFSASFLFGETQLITVTTYFNTGSVTKSYRISRFEELLEQGKIHPNAKIVYPKNYTPKKNTVDFSKDNIYDETDPFAKFYNK